ncbi:ABC transporter ATP-binding protein [Dactylosporangium roseum]|uniref:ABC transporter ATP-binding protein n=1 Tax=Dactylosporangium roseum TaxID=47989 RepID=A0ABY5ZCA3_9ACTN|nr:ABC transporter ATP-binding protein [Dactylosporangium roseum]UWZ39196.1 ABC transporter ATP-binding protein [Dactylosporangium roseum]
MTWAGGGGGHYGGGSWSANSGANLPFGGIPAELQSGVDKLLATEPVHGEPKAGFTHRAAEAEQARLTLRSLLVSHWRLGLIAVLSMISVSVFTQAGPRLIDEAISRGMGEHRSFGVVLVISMVFLATVVISALAQWAQVAATGRLAARVMYRLRVRVFTHLQRLGLDYYTDEKAGVIMTRMTSDIENMQQLLQDGLAQFIVQAMTMAVITAMLFSMNVTLAWITIVLIVPALVALSVWFHGAAERGYARVRDGITAVLTDLSESLHGVRVVVAHNRQHRNIVHHRNVVGEYRDANDYTATINAIYGPGTQTVGYLAQAALLAIGAYMMAHNRLGPGELVAFFLYLNRFYAPIQLMVQQYNLYQQGQSSIRKLRTLLAQAPSVRESPEATVLPPIRGEIAFEDVTFGYDPARPVLRELNLRIAAGETVAFVGVTGAGKSTIAKLVTRFYDPTAGRVLIDGHDLRDVGVHSLRSQLGVVPQESFLFAGSIRDNICFADPDASDEQVWDAVRAVGLADVVERLPGGIHAIVHERGLSLSSGERQLVALARAFLARPRVLILDEATSNLDLLSESRIEAALDVLLEARTAILIAHRLTTAMKADRIVVVEHGRVVESGHHDALVSLGGRYAEMFATWSSRANEQAA